MKSSTSKNETHKEYRNLFERIKRKSEKYYDSTQILKYKDNIKQTWLIIKEVIGKTKMIHNNLPEKLTNTCRWKIYSGPKEETAIEFNNFFVRISPKLAEKI